MGRIIGAGVPFRGLTATPISTHHVRGVLLAASNAWRSQRHASAWDLYDDHLFCILGKRAAPLWYSMAAPSTLDLTGPGLGLDDRGVVGGASDDLLCK